MQAKEKDNKKWLDLPVQTETEAKSKDNMERMDLLVLTADELQRPYQCLKLTKQWTRIYIYKMKNLEIAIYFVVENDKWIEEEGENLKGFGLFVIVQVIGVDSVYIYMAIFELRLISWECSNKLVSSLSYFSLVF